MYSLVLIWLCIGLLIGLLVCLACLHSASWSRRWWFILPGIASGAAICGGLLGIVFLGRYFCFATALWVAILVPVVAWNIVRMSAAKQEA